jgi:myo-inositol-1(or 4)-monophosphatase
MDEHLLQEMVELATRLGQDGAQLARDRLRDATIDIKADASVVTDADHAVQSAILEVLARRFPDHAVVAEETIEHPDRHADRREARFCWAIDPIDGTRNYATGFPSFATSIGVLDQGVPVVGVVVEHNSGQVYVAARGRPPEVDGLPMTMRSTGPEIDQLVGIPSSKDPLSVAVISRWAARRGLILRNLGSAAMHLALVACGGLDATFMKKCKLWDVAAGAVMVLEAGAVMTDPQGNPRVPFDLSQDPGLELPTLAATPELHTELLADMQDLV